MLFQLRTTPEFYTDPEARTVPEGARRSPVSTCSAKSFSAVSRKVTRPAIRTPVPGSGRASGVAACRGTSDAARSPNRRVSDGNQTRTRGRTGSQARPCRHDEVDPNLRDHCGRPAARRDRRPPERPGTGPRGPRRRPGTDSHDRDCQRCAPRPRGLTRSRLTPFPPPGGSPRPPVLFFWEQAGVSGPWQATERSPPASASVRRRRVPGDGERRGGSAVAPSGDRGRGPA